MVLDYMDAMKDTMLDDIRNVLKNAQTENIIGLQTLEASIDWTGIQGYESIINVLFTESVNAPQEAKKIRERIATEPDLYMSGTLDALKEQAEEMEKGLIPVGRVENMCEGIRNYIYKIKRLVEEGFVVEYPDEGIVTHVYLPQDLWGNYIAKIVREGKETQVFGSAIGKVIAIAMHDKKYGFNSLKPILLAYMKCDKKTGELSSEVFLQQCCSAISKPGRFYANLKERMETKTDEIKAIKYWADGRIIMNANGITAVRQWQKLAMTVAQNYQRGQP